MVDRKLSTNWNSKESKTLAPLTLKCKLNRWQIKAPGRVNPFVIAPTQLAALEAADVLFRHKQVTLMVYLPNGKLMEERRYPLADDDPLIAAMIENTAVGDSDTAS